MTLNLINLEDDKVRELMLKEVEEDILNKKIYFSFRLKEECRKVYLDLLKKSIQEGNDKSFAEGILNKNCLKAVTPRKTPSGKVMAAKVPSDAHFTLAEGEFNRFYLRAICLKVTAEGGGIEVYRAKTVTSPRPESQAIIGKIIDANKLLTDLRTNIGIDTAFGLPNGPNSGLSGKIKGQ